MACAVCSPAAASAPPSTRGPRSVALTPTGGAGERSLDLAARRLAYRPQPRCVERCGATLELSGEVRLQLGTMRLRAARLEVAIDGGGEARTAVASGAVTLEDGRRRGRAERVELQIDRQRLVLLGAAELSAAALVLRGDRVEVDLRSGRIVVDQAHVRLQRDPGAPR